MGDMNTRQWLSFSFQELWHSLLEFNNRTIWQHFKNWMRRNNKLQIRGFKMFWSRWPNLEKSGAVTIEIVCHELIFMTRVAGDIQSSSRRNFGSCRLVLRPWQNILKKCKWRFRSCQCGYCLSSLITLKQEKRIVTTAGCCWACWV